MKRTLNEAKQGAKRSRNDNRSDNQPQHPLQAPPEMHEGGRRQEARLIAFAMEALRRPDSGLRGIHIRGFSLNAKPMTELKLQDEQDNLWGLLCRTSADELESAEDCMNLAEALAQNTSLEQLSVFSSARECLPILMALIRHAGLRSLQWSEIPESEDSIESAPEFPLNLSSIGEAVFAVSEILRSNRLTRLSLTGLRFCSEDFQRIARALQANTSLQAFDLASMLIGDEDCEALVDALASRKNLRQLALTDRMLIGDRLTQLAKLLRLNPNIEELDLSGNLMVAGQLSELTQAFSLHGEMRRLAFTMCFPQDDALPDENVHDLLEAARENRNLERLDFGGLILSMEGGQAIRKFFETSKVWAPLNQIELLVEDSVEASMLLAKRLHFLYGTLDQLGPIQDIARDVLTLHVREKIPDYNRDILNYIIELMAILPRGKDALVSLARVVGFQLEEDEPMLLPPTPKPEAAAPADRADRARPPVVPASLLRRRRARRHRNPRPAQD